jgi:menaquinone-dependent protoporphyrinogen IX oxidase
MKDCLVIYSSKSGFTEKYANWIAEALECEAVRLRDLESTKMNKARTLVYGGCINAGWVLGLKKFLRRVDQQKNQNVFVFGVGLSPSNSSDAERYHTANLNGSDKKIPWFYFQGGMDIDKLRGFEKLLIKIMIETSTKAQRKLALKAGKSVEEFVNPLKQDHCDREAIKPLVEAVKAVV